VGEYCVPASQDCASITVLNSTSIVIRSDFPFTKDQIWLGLEDPATHKSAAVNYTVTQINQTSIGYYTEVDMEYDSTDLTPGQATLLVKFKYLQNCTGLYNRDNRADLAVSISIQEDTSWGLPTFLKQISKLPQYLLIAGFFLTTITGRRRTFWSLYNTVLLLSYQGLMITTLPSDTQKFMLTVSRLSLFPNFFNLILQETATESIEDANLNHYGKLYFRHTEFHPPRAHRSFHHHWSDPMHAVPYWKAAD
jgi:hypothetical protein